MVVEPYHRYSNEAERANKDIYDDLKLKKTLNLYDFYKNISTLQALKQRCMNV